MIDPSCGDGVFIRACSSICETYGCELDPSFRPELESLLPPRQLILGDALTDLVPLWETFDVALGNPPFSAQAHLEKRSHVLQGFDLGAGKTSQCLEILFIELFLKLLKPRGRMAIILPDGPLSNIPFDYVRQWLARHATIDAIISLPRHIFNRTSAKTNILVARKQFPALKPYREPTRFFVCSDLQELDHVSLSPRFATDKSSGVAILADCQDWRPEALLAGRHQTGSDYTRLGDAFRLRTGAAKYGKQRKLFELPAADRILLLRAKNIRSDGGLKLNAALGYIRRGDTMYREDAVLQPGEIVFVRVGAGCYGRTAVIPSRFHAQADDWLHVLTPFTKVDAAGLVEWLNNAEGREALRRLAKGVGTVSISKSALAELRIPARFVTPVLVLREAPATYHVTRRKNADRRVVARKRADPIT